MTATQQKELPFSSQLDPDRMRAAARETTALLRALANENRLIILCQLTQGESSVAELNALLPLSQSALSQHLSRLRRDGLVSDRRNGTQVFYSLVPGPAEAVLENLYSVFCETRS